MTVGSWQWMGWRRRREVWRRRQWRRKRMAAVKEEDSVCENSQNEWLVGGWSDDKMACSGCCVHGAIESAMAAWCARLAMAVTL